MNEQTKKTQVRFNFFDMLLLILVLIIVGACAALFIWRTGNDDDTVRLQYTVLVKDLPEEVNIRAEAGQPVVDTIKLGTIGEVVSYRIVPANYDAYSYDTQTLIHGEYEDMISVYFTFETDAVKNDIGYMIGNIRVAVGAQMFFRTPSFLGYGFVTDITEIAE